MIDNCTNFAQALKSISKTIGEIAVCCVDLANIDLKRLSNLKKLMIDNCTSANSILRKNSEYYDDSENFEIEKTSFTLNGQKELDDNIQGFESHRLQQEQSRKDFLERLEFLLNNNAD
jgi:hypothetical protein